MAEQIARMVRLGERPDGLKDTLRVRMPDGTEGLIPVTFRYRTRAEFGEFLDSIFGIEVPAFDGAARDAGAVQQRGIVQYNGQYLHGCIQDWGLDVPLSLHACTQLANELPGPARALMDRYRERILEGRAGN